MRPLQAEMRARHEPKDAEFNSWLIRALWREQLCAGANEGAADAAAD